MTATEYKRLCKIEDTFLKNVFGNNMNEPLKPLIPRKDKSAKYPKQNTTSKPKPVKPGKDWATIAYLNRKRDGTSGLAERYPRRKGTWIVKKNERREVIEILYPFVHNFIATRISFRKMPKGMQNDPRNLVMNYFDLKYKTSTGSLVINEIEKETKKQFTKAEILNTLINTIYRNRIDYLSFILKPKPKEITVEVKEKSVSLWDRISEHSHV